MDPGRIRSATCPRHYSLNTDAAAKPAEQGGFRAPFPIWARLFSPSQRAVGPSFEGRSPPVRFKVRFRRFPCITGNQQGTRSFSAPKQGDSGCFGRVMADIASRLQWLTYPSLFFCGTGNSFFTEQGTNSALSGKRLGITGSSAFAVRPRQTPAGASNSRAWSSQSSGGVQSISRLSDTPCGWRPSRIARYISGARKARRASRRR